MSHGGGHQVYLGLGSNIEPEASLCAGLKCLHRVLDNLEISSVYFSDAVGFEGPPFLNMAVSGRSELSLFALAARLRAIEFEFGRRVNQQKFSSRRLDIDILLYDDLCGSFGNIVLPRAEILENAYVLGPLVELNPAFVHPYVGKTLAEIWQDYLTVWSQAASFKLHTVSVAGLVSVAR